MRSIPKFVILFMLIGAFVGCDTPRVRQPITKVIKEKIAATEQRLGFDWFDSNNSFRSRAETVYYLVAEDGTLLRVRLEEYAKTSVGQSVTSTLWK